MRAVFDSQMLEAVVWRELTHVVGGTHPLERVPWAVIRILAAADRYAVSAGGDPGAGRRDDLMLAISRRRR